MSGFLVYFGPFVGEVDVVSVGAVLHHHVEQTERGNQGTDHYNHHPPVVAGGLNINNTFKSFRQCSVQF